MSCPNFQTQRNFPLYCYDDTEMEWWEAQDFFGLVQSDLDEMNSDLRFFKITLNSGYYCGVQLFVQMQHYAFMAGFDEDGPEDADNEDCRYYLDMCRSEAVRKYWAEQRKVLKLMEKIGAAWGFEEYVCTAIFSNGEAIYDKASNPRARLKAAVA